MITEHTNTDPTLREPEYHIIVEIIAVFFPTNKNTYGRHNSSANLVCPANT